MNNIQDEEPGLGSSIILFSQDCWTILPDMHTLFPAIKPYDVQYLDVGDGHSLYVEQCGSPDGIPVVVLHGGPGAGVGENSRRFFDPNEYRIILFDQRGCGRSTPHASIKHNTTDHLIRDIETIREHLNIERWMLFGGSWGSTLALLYAIRHTRHVDAMVLRGIWLLRQEDIAWMYGDQGARKLFPDCWQRFIQAVPENKRDNLVQAYYDILTGEDEIARMAAAKAWGLWEANCCSLEPNPNMVEQLTEPHTALSFASITTHYILNSGFITENEILENIEAISKIPGYIIHGRYDAICPAEGAWSLHQAWPKSELIFVRDAGHSASEPAIVDALVHATDCLAK